MPKWLKRVLLCRPARRKTSALPAFCLSLFLILSFTTRASAGDPMEAAPDPSAGGKALDDWGLAITPYAWFAANSTDVGGQEIRQSFNDLASLTNLGFQCRLLARWRRLVFTADWTYADMGSGHEISRITLDFGVKQHILDMKFGGVIYNTRTAAQDGGIGIWLSAGARYWDNTVDYTLTIDPILPGGDPTVEQGTDGQTWWDPVLGLTFHFPVTPGVGFFVRATAGGLGIGSASDYMWDGEFSALFRLSRRLLLTAGYRQFKYSRTDGEGDDEVKQTVTVVGPAIGLSIGIF
jgi:hypothetical protein